MKQAQSVGSAVSRASDLSIEQRRDARFVRRLGVELAGAQLHTTNLAPGGMQVEIPAMRYAGLLALVGRRTPEWRILLPGQPLPLIASGDFRYADLVDDDYLAGIAFVAWHAYGEERWRDYVSSLEPIKTHAG